MSETLTPDEAHAVRPSSPWPRATLTTRIATAIAAAMRDRRSQPGRAEVERDEPLDALVAVLSSPFRPEGFAMGATVVVTGRMVEPRVWVRAQGRTWALTTVEAGVAAIRCRIEAPALIGQRLAEAFNHAVRLAERRMDALNAASPTAEVEA